MINFTIIIITKNFINVVIGIPLKNASIITTQKRSFYKLRSKKQNRLPDNRWVLVLHNVESNK